MNVKITPAEIKTPKTKRGDPYLWVKTVSGKILTSWDKYQYIWHLIKLNEEIVVEIIEDGKFINIVGIPGIEAPNESGGITVYKTPKEPLQGQNGALTGTPNAWDALWLRLDKMEKAIDFLVEEKMALDSLKAMDKGLKYEDIPITDLPDLN